MTAFLLRWGTAEVVARPEISGTTRKVRRPSQTGRRGMGLQHTPIRRGGRSGGRNGVCEATRRTASRSWRPASSTCAWSAALPEVRIDPLTGLKTIVAADRATRPGEQGFRADPAPPIDAENDPFVEGHEDRTPPELYAVRP